MTRTGKTKKSQGRTRAATAVPRESVRETAGAPSPTAVAAEAMATGVVPLAAREKDAALPGQDHVVTAGEADERPENAAFVGDVTPGGDMPTPDQNQVDAYGHAMGVPEADSGALRTSGEILDKRDRSRAFQDVPEDHSREQE
jgi:hypothetical protein